MDSFWDFFWFTISFFLLMAYLVVLFQILTDLFRDKDTSGWLKAVWVFFLIILPLLTSLVYLIARGQGMAERNISAAQAAQADADAYIRSVATTRLAVRRDRQGQGAARLRRDHARQEFDALKAKALG